MPLSLLRASRMDARRQRGCWWGVLGQAVVVLLSALLLGTGGCAEAPLDYPRQPSAAISDPQSTYLGWRLGPQLAGHPGQSAFFPLIGGADALVARLSLIDAAERTVDAQCFLFGDDVAGTIVLEHLFAAADRGVRVRLLVDDWSQAGEDARLAAIGAHRNVQVRIFNPVGAPRWNPLTRPWEYAWGPERTRRRMHNKAIIVDNVAAVVGGRNIADEYFGAGEDANFGDVDLLAVGPMAQQVSMAFDQFWNDRLSVPAQAFVDDGRMTHWVEQTRRSLSRHRSALTYEQYVQRLRKSELIPRLESGRLPVVWAEGEFLYDRPAKAISSIEQNPAAYMVFRVDQIVQESRCEALMISPYLVPGEGGAQWFERLCDRGVKVKVLTNSLASTDEISTYGAYKRYRARLLRYGVQIYELRAEPEPRPGAPARARGSDSPPRRWALHAKCMVLDRQVVFIGSLNLDRRSARLDTQDGIVVRSPEMAARMAALFEARTAPNAAYQLVLRQTLSGKDESGLAWVGQTDGRKSVQYDNPGTSPWRRFSAWVLSWLAPESAL